MPNGDFHGGHGGRQKKGGGTKKIARSSKSGRFVKKSYAKTHPSTTVVERVKKTTSKKRVTKKATTKKGTTKKHGTKKRTTKKAARKSRTK